MENPDWVSVFGLTADRTVVLIREYHHGAGVVGLGLPGGAADHPGETMLAAAARELSEETGYGAGELISLGGAYANWGNQTNRIHFFLGLDCQLVGPQRLDENEEIEVSLIPLNEFDVSSMQQAFHFTNALLAMDYIRHHDR
jgi:8-oxo-dGTP pyrophosphatase MutT (NUDIX family)